MPLRRVALLIETSRQFGRDMLRGVVRYQLEHTPWEISFEPLGFHELEPSWFGNWRGDGILARIHRRDLARKLKRKRIPLVDLRGMFGDLKVPAVQVDNREIVRLAVDHLAEIGLTRFAYVGVPAGQDPWLDDRCAEFRRLLDRRGAPYFVYESRGGIVDNRLTDERAAIARWLVELPKPIGILAYNDYRGQQVLDACRSIGVRVPDDAAVIGVDNDEFTCRLTAPTLTSVSFNTQEAGYQAARVLDRMMNGFRTERERIYLRAKSLMVRQSTNFLAMDDEVVRTAVRYLREHACERIGVKDVLRQVDVSRRTLEQRFLTIVGRMLNDEIIRIRMEHARRLLSETRLATEEIAAKVGVATAAHFSQLFKKQTGLTPREFRNQYLI